jgi:hypothetical protein
MSEPLTFIYFDRPEVTAIDPPCGPVTGYTQIKVSGKNFQSLGPNMAYCVFNNTHFMNVTFIDSEHLYCSSPKLNKGQRSLPANQLFYELRITIDNKHSQSRSFKPFNYYFDAQLSAVVDSNVGPILGGTDSILEGKGFTHPNVCNLKVRYGAIEVTPKQVNSTFIITTSPRVNLPGAVVLSTSGNGQNYADDVTLHYRDKENTFTYVQDLLVDFIHPQQGPCSGGTKVSVRGIGFTPIKDDDGREITSRPLMYRILDGEAQFTKPAPVEDLTNDSFNWYSPACPSDSKKVKLQISWDKQNWQTILPLGKDHTF